MGLCDKLSIALLPSYVSAGTLPIDTHRRSVRTVQRSPLRISIETPGDGMFAWGLSPRIKSVFSLAKTAATRCTTLDEERARWLFAIDAQAVKALRATQLGIQGGATTCASVQGCSSREHQELAKLLAMRKNSLPQPCVDFVPGSPTNLTFNELKLNAARSQVSYQSEAVFHTGSLHSSS